MVVAIRNRIDQIAVNRRLGTRGFEVVWVADLLDPEDINLRLMCRTCGYEVVAPSIEQVDGALACAIQHRETCRKVTKRDDRFAYRVGTSDRH